MIFFRKTALWALLLLLCLSLGCQPGQTAESPAPSPQPVVTEEPILTPSPTPFLTPSPAPMTISPVTSTPPPTAVPTPEPTPSPSPAPAFVPATPDPSLRLKRSMVKVTPGLYQNKNTKEYLRFGSFGQEPPAFYASKADADPVFGASSLPLETVFLSPYAPKNPPDRNGDRYLTVYLGSQSVVCFLAKDGDWTVERIMVCSTADDEHRTPLGSATIYEKYKYKALTKMDGIMVYGQYASRFRGNFLFHTVPIGGGSGRNTQTYGKKQMLIEEYEKMGSPASHGCVRLLVGDAYWVYNNCAMGTRVYVTKAVGPPAPDAPALIYEEPYMSADQTLGWDPTDPDPENPYRVIYPEWFEE